MQRRSDSAYNGFFERGPPSRQLLREVMNEIDDKEMSERIERLTYAEVSRWKAMHDAELRRMKIGTLVSIVVGLIASFGAGHFWFEAIVSRAVRDSLEPSFRIIAEYRSKFVAEADAAQNAASEARLSAERAAASTDKAVADKLLQIANADSDAALHKFLSAAVDPLRADVNKAKATLSQTLGELKNAIYEVSQRSGGIATHPPYKIEMEEHAFNLKAIHASLLSLPDRK